MTTSATPDKAEAGKTETVQPQNAQAKKPLNPETRLARMMLPDLDPHSPLLPTNKWIISTVKDMVKTHQGIRVCLKRAGAFALGGLAALAAGAAGAFMAPGLLAAGGIAAASLVAAGTAGFFAKKQLEKIKTDHMGDVQEIVKNKYLEMKAGELARAWKERAEKVRLERAAKREQEAAQKAAAAQEAAKQAAVEKPAEKPVAQPADKSVAEKPSTLKTFGRWAAAKAREGAHKLEDKIHEAVEQKLDAPKPANNDRPPAPPKNSAPKNGG